MYYKLNEYISLRGWEKLPYAVVDKRRRYPLFIKAKEMQALEMCNGTVDFDWPFIPAEIREMIPQIEKNGFIVPCKAGDSNRPEQEYKRYPARYIRTAHWSITGHCNYRCKHCYMSAPDAKYGQLSHEQVMDIARQIVDCGIREVSLTGGEPLVRKDFFDIVDVLLAGGVKITTIYSNGKLVTDPLLDELDKRGIHPEFNMSYDGVDGWHDWLRGIEDAGKIAEEAFARCRDRGFPTGAEMCIHGGNKHLLRETVNRLAELGCRSLKTNPIANVGAWKEGGYGTSLDMGALFQLYLDYIPHYYEDGMPLSLQLGGFFMADPKMPEKYAIPSVKVCNDASKHKICNHARMVMYISAEGRALPCMALSGMDIQKNYPLIPEIGISGCITDSSYMRLIDTTASTVLEHNEDCRSCEHALVCLGGCRASALETSPDDILAIDEACCAIFKGGWIAKIDDVMKKIKSEATRPGKKTKRKGGINMSENLKQFFELMNNDPEIKEKALTCNELGKEKVRLALIELAKESGIELSEADFVEQPVESEELDMEELGAVVGGAGICLCAMAGGGGGTDAENGKTYGCACVGYGQGGDGRISDANCACVAMGEGHDDYKCY